MGRRSRAWFGLAASIAALGALPAGTASATTWEGRCEIEGTSTFDEPFGGLPEPGAYTDAGTGRCTGTLDGAAVEDTPILLEARGEGTSGCLAGATVMPGRLIFTRGTETPDDDVSFGYVGEAAGVFPNYVSLTRGAVSGRGIAYVEMLSRGDPGAFERCRDGTMTEASWRAVTTTFGPNEG